MAESGTSISVGSSVEGSIIVGDNNFAVNQNYGTIVYKQAAPEARLRSVAPRAPRAPRGFIGREHELAEINDYVRSKTPVLLLGTEGIGKSTLLKQAANGESAAQPNGVVYLEGIDPAGEVLTWDDIIQMLFDSLFETEPGKKVNIASARTYLSNTTPLVLLDNFKLHPEALNDLADLFPQAPILAVTPVSLETEAFESLKIAAPSLSEAIKLFAKKAALNADLVSPALLEKFCNLLALLPLALVTVANVIRENELELEAALQKLETIQPTATIPSRAAIERSYLFANAYLSEEERQMIIQAAASPGISTSREMLEKTSGGPTASQNLEKLEILQANSPRLRLHPAFAPLALAGADITMLRNRLLSAILESLQADPTNFDLIKVELGNIIGLIAWLVSEQRWQEAITLGRYITPFLTLRGLWGAWERSLNLVLLASRASADQAAEAWALHELGTRQIGLGDLVSARQLLERALEIRQSQGDTTASAYTLHNLGYLSSLAPITAAANDTLAEPKKGKNKLSRVLIFILPALLLAGGIYGIASAGPLRQGRFAQMLGLVQPTPTPTATLAPTSTQTPTVTPTSTLTPTYTPTSTLTPTVTQTPTKSPTPTRSLTPTASLTPTISLTPSATEFAFPTALVTANQGFCRYGPGTAYLRAADLFQGDTGEVRGRDYPSTWLLLKLDKSGQFCWTSIQTVNVTGDVSTVKVTSPNLPITPDTPIPTDVTATRKNNQVTITWKPVPLAPDDSHGYLLDVKICNNGGLVQYVIQTDNTSYTFTDAQTCSKPSKGKLYAVSVRGYSTPVDIPWP